MAKSSRPSHDPKRSKPSKNFKDRRTVRTSRTTVSGPATPDASGRGDVTAEKAAAAQEVSSVFTFNPNKAAEYDPEAFIAPPEGASVKPSDPIAVAAVSGLLLLTALVACWRPARRAMKVDPVSLLREQ